MDSSKPQEASSSITDHRRKSTDEEDSPEIPSAERSRFLPPTFRQNWSFPDSIIYYLAMNPSSSDLYETLISSCKYFFFKNPSIVCTDINFDARKNLFQMEVINLEYSTNINLDNISHKFWLNGYINIHGMAGKENIISSIIPHIYLCEAKLLYLLEQKITWKEFLLLTSSVEYLSLDNSVVSNVDGSIVSFEKILDAVVNVKHVEYECCDDDKSISSETVENLLQIPHFSTIKSFDLGNIPLAFDLDAFFTYIKKNVYTDIKLDFSVLFFEQYEDRLDAIVDEILSDEEHNFKTPMFEYVGLDADKRDKMDKLFKRSQSRIY